MTDLILNKDELSKFSKILKKLDTNDEFEIMFGGYNKNNNLKLKEFLEMLKFMKSYADDKKLKVEHTETLDISYSYDTKNYHTYRISINGIDSINSHIASIHNRSNSIIFSTLSSKILSKTDKNLQIIDKRRDFENRYSIDRYNLRIRVSKEENVVEKKIQELVNLKNIDKMSILFRMKSRLSLILEDNNDASLKLDVTSVKQSNNINNIQEKTPNYEMELEFLKKTNKAKNYEEKIFNYLNIFKKVIEQTNNIITNDEKRDVVELYYKLLDSKSSLTLYGMQPSSLEVVHLVDKIANVYAVCDKADGDRSLGIIHNQKLYLLSTNLDVTYTGVKISDKSYNNTILDGEYIFNPEYNKYIFTVFDILYYKDKNVQEEESLERRLKYLMDVVNKCFSFKFTLNKYNGKYDLNDITEYYKSDMVKYLETMMNGLKKTKDETFICFKYFIFPLGGSNSEIYRYSEILWNMYTKSDSDKVPYILDGLIYTSISQKYTRISKDIKNPTYKWKPPHNNTIDFFVRYEKNSNGKILNVYDNTLDDIIQDKTYKILNLHVGKVINNMEVPVLFKKNENLHIAKIGNVDNVIRDCEGDIIQDNSVVEFYYNKDSDIPLDFRWIPLRTRHDKIDSINKFKRKYGNNSNIANFIWSSIQQNITIDDIAKLGDESIYESELFEIKKRIDATVVAIEKQKDVYYQKKSEIAVYLRAFHNYIKSNIIFTYCSPKIKNGSYKKLSVLDVGCGKGGDIQKFFHSKVSNLVGIDPDAYGIHSATDGAVSRYNTHKRKMPNYPKMDFLVCNATAEFNLDSQKKVIGKTTDLNENLIRNIFGQDKDKLSNRKFDVFNCSIMIHYLFKDDISINNFCNNINNYLADDGYLLISTFDGDMIHNEFIKNNGIINSHYVVDGEKKKLFEFKMLYDKNIKDINRAGLSYNSYVSIFKDDENYELEHLVPKDYMIKLFKEKCNLDLIESESFYENYLQKKDFFENVAPKEENASTKNYFMKVSQYYNMDEINKAGVEFTKFHKYYIFKKRYVECGKKETKKKEVKKVKYVKSDKTVKKKSRNLIDNYINSNTVLDI